MRNFRPFFSEKHIFFDKIAIPILRKICVLQKKGEEIGGGSLFKIGVFMVEPGGIEPPTFCMPCKRSTN